MKFIEKIISSPVIRETLWKVALAALFLFLGVFFVNVIIKALKKILYKGDHQQKKKTLFTVLSSLIKYIIYFITMMIILEIFGIKTSSIVAVAGIGSVALGFGAQVLVEDMISGLFILAEDQFNVGDYITVADYSGTVEGMSLRTTTLRTYKGELCVVPNGEIRGVTNYSKDYMNALVDLPIPYEINVDEIMELINNKLEDYFVIGQTLESPTVLGIKSYGDSAINITVRCKCHTGQNWTVERNLRKHLLNILEAEGIEVPYNTQTVHLANTPQDEA